MRKAQSGLWIQFSKNHFSIFRICGVKDQGYSTVLWHSLTFHPTKRLHEFLDKTLDRRPTLKPVDRKTDKSNHRVRRRPCAHMFSTISVHSWRQKRIAARHARMCAFHCKNGTCWFSIQIHIVQVTGSATSAAKRIARIAVHFPSTSNRYP